MGKISYFDLGKRLYDENPMGICEIPQLAWDGFRKAFPEPSKVIDTQGFFTGLRLVVSNAVPPNEIHFISRVRGEDGKYRRRVDKIINIGEVF
jgi:hypothetical protein